MSGLRARSTQNRESSTTSGATEKLMRHRNMKKTTA